MWHREGQHPRRRPSMCGVRRPFPIPTEGDFAQELIRPSECGHWTILPGVVFRREPAWAGREGVETPCVPAGGGGSHRPPGRPVAQRPTTNVSTAAMLVYAAGAGITAAAGTRLALQLVLITVFGLHPFQVPPDGIAGGIAAVRRCLTQCFCIGQFARLLPTLVVAAVSQAPSPESNPNSPSPVAATVVHYATVPELIGQKFVRSSMLWPEPPLCQRRCPEEGPA